MKNLAQKMQELTKKERNRILFKGGLTLSELALQMWEALGHQKVDAANLSRVLHGERLFTPEQLEVFCHILKLNQYEISDMRSALYKDYYEKYGIVIEPSVSPYFLDTINLQLKQTSQTRRLGQPEMTIEWVTTLSEQIDTIIRSNSISSSHPVQKIYAQILLKQIRIYREILLPSRTIPIISPLVGKIFVIAYDRRDKELLGQAYLSLSDALIILQADIHKLLLSFNQLYVLLKILQLYSSYCVICHYR